MGKTKFLIDEVLGATSVEPVKIGLDEGERVIAEEKKAVEKGPRKVGRPKCDQKKSRYTIYLSEEDKAALEETGRRISPFQEVPLNALFVLAVKEFIGRHRQ